MARSPIIAKALLISPVSPKAAMPSFANSAGAFAEVNRLAMKRTEVPISLPVCRVVTPIPVTIAFNSSKSIPAFLAAAPALCRARANSLEVIACLDSTSNHESRNLTVPRPCVS